MGNETKERLPLRMKPETSRRLEQWYAADNCRSKNEFVEKAVNFYVDYLEMRDDQSLLPTALLAVLDGRLGRDGDRPGRSEAQTGGEHPQRESHQRSYLTGEAGTLR